MIGYESGIQNTTDKGLKGVLQQKFEKESVRLKGQEAALKNLCHKTGRQYESPRTQVYAVMDFRGNIVGFNRSISQKTRWYAEKYYQAWAKSIGAETGPKNLAGYYNSKYNNTIESRLYRGYIKAVNKGNISPLVGYELFKNVYYEAANLLLGKKTSNGQDIREISVHLTERIIGEYEDAEFPLKGKRIGVSIDKVADAILNGKAGEIKVRSDGRKGQLFVGKKCKVSFNPDTKTIIQVSPGGTE